MQKQHHRHPVSTIAVAAIKNPAAVLAAALLGLTASPSRAECGPLAAEVDARCCSYFHQEGTLFVNARSSGYAVVIGKPDFADAHNSIKIDHLIANNGGSGGGVQLNYVLNADIFVVADSAAQIGLDVEQMQFSVLRGAASAETGTAMMMGPGYIFANTF